MRVLIVRAFPFGTFELSRNYLETLRELGIDACFAGFAPAPSYVKAVDHVYHCFGTYQARRFAAYIDELVRELAIDIVHVHHFRGAGLIPLLSKSSTKHLVEIISVHVQNYRGSADILSPLKDRITWLETLAFNYVLCNTHEIATRMRPTIRPLSLMQHGVNGKFFSRMEKTSFRAELRGALGIEPTAPVLIYAGSLTPSRKFDRVLSAFAVAYSTYRQAHLLVVGGSLGVDIAEDPQIVPLRQLAASLGVDAHVHFIGRVPYEVIPRYYTAAEIGISYVPPQTAYENQHVTKIIEYMMGGLITITNRTAGAKAIYGDDTTAIVHGESVEEMTEAIQRAIRLLEPEYELERMQMLDNARRRAQLFDLRQIFPEQLFPVYNALLASR